MNYCDHTREDLSDYRPFPSSGFSWRVILDRVEEFCYHNKDNDKTYYAVAISDNFSHCYAQQYFSGEKH